MLFPEFSVDRCAPRAAPEDAQLAAFSRTCYEFKVGRGGSFTEARAYCQSHSGDLVHGMSPAATTFIYAELERRKTTLKTQLVWIGAQKEPGLTSRTWKWVNGMCCLNNVSNSNGILISFLNYKYKAIILLINQEQRLGFF